jgi:hypothetical protein
MSSDSGTADLLNKRLKFTMATDKSVLLQPKSVGRTPMAIRFRAGRDQSEWFVITLQVEVQESE